MSRQVTSADTSAFSIFPIASIVVTLAGRLRTFASAWSCAARASPT